MELVAYSYEPAQIKDLELDFLRVSDETSSGDFASIHKQLGSDVGHRKCAHSPFSRASHHTGHFFCLFLDFLFEAMITAVLCW